MSIGAYSGIPSVPSQFNPTQTFQQVMQPVAQVYGAPMYAPPAMYSPQVAPQGQNQPIPTDLYQPLPQPAVYGAPMYAPPAMYSPQVAPQGQNQPIPTDLYQPLPQPANNFDPALYTPVSPLYETPTALAGPRIVAVPEPQAPNAQHFSVASTAASRGLSAPASDNNNLVMCMLLFSDDPLLCMVMMETGGNPLGGGFGSSGLKAPDNHQTTSYTNLLETPLLMECMLITSMFRGPILSKNQNVLSLCLLMIKYTPRDPAPALQTTSSPSFAMPTVANSVPMAMPSGPTFSYSGPARAPVTKSYSIPPGAYGHIGAESSFYNYPSLGITGGPTIIGRTYGANGIGEVPAFGAYGMSAGIGGVPAFGGYGMRADPGLSYGQTIYREGSGEDFIAKYAARKKAEEATKELLQEHEYLRGWNGDIHGFFVREKVSPAISSSK